jgi:hypothetical protein
MLPLKVAVSHYPEVYLILAVSYYPGVYLILGVLYYPEVNIVSAVSRGISYLTSIVLNRDTRISNLHIIGSIQARGISYLIKQQYPIIKMMQKASIATTIHIPVPRAKIYFIL